MKDLLEYSDLERMEEYLKNQIRLTKLQLNNPSSKASIDDQIEEFEEFLKVLQYMKDNLFV